MIHNKKVSKIGIKDCFGILTIQDRKKIILTVMLQIALNFLDLIGVILIGLLATISIASIQNQPYSKSVNNILQLLFLFANLRW